MTWLDRFIFLTLAVLAWQPSWGSEVKSLVYVTGKVLIRIEDIPCHKNILELIPEEYKARFHGGSVSLPDKHLMLCWAIQSDDMVFIVDEAGDAGSIPIAAFERGGI